jgi:hypothetical protein
VDLGLGASIIVGDGTGGVTGGFGGIGAGLAAIGAGVGIVGVTTGAVAIVDVVPGGVVDDSGTGVFVLG